MGLPITMIPWFLIITSILGILWALFNAKAVSSIDLTKQNSFMNYDKLPDDTSDVDVSGKIKAMMSIGRKIASGADAFLTQEYNVMFIFIIFFGALVLFVVDILGKEGGGFAFYATFAYVVGSLTSMLCGWIGMKIAVASNFRTAFQAITSLEAAFECAYRAGCVMGFSMIGTSLLVIVILFETYKRIYQPEDDLESARSWTVLMELLAGYGLGGSSIALFGRVGGGIYTKAADVGADLVGKVEEGLDEDSPKNPATIADNVGDNVGDIAGMGADLFGSFAESTCAALVFVSGNATLVESKSAIYFPMLISGVGIIACIFTSIYGIYVYSVNTFEKIEKALKIQLFLSTILTLAGLPIIALWSLPDEWEETSGGKVLVINKWYAVISTGMGLISGFLIGLSTDYYTSNAHRPVQEMAEACSGGAAINIIFGLALGYLSTIVPILLLALTIIVGITLCGLFGVALAALGMLSTLCIGLAIDAYGPISDNAGGIAEMSEIGDDVRKKTDALDAAGNTTAAIGKGFAIGSACLVSLALYGAFVFRAKGQKKNKLHTTSIEDGWVFGSLIVGAMLPYAFSAMTMKSVGKAAQEMVEEVRRQFRNPQIKSGEIDPDYESCIKVSTSASIREMIAPGLLVILTPIAAGCIFHPVIVAGLLPGALVSGIQLAISMSNTGGAWDNAKKHIESGVLGRDKGKGSDEHKAAVIGDTVGDPLKDTSGPSLNILIKLMAIISLVFATGFSKTSFLAGVLRINSDGVTA